MARQPGDNDSANSQFFICFADAPQLNGKYTVFGEVVSGMDVVDKIKKGSKSNNGMVTIRTRSSSCASPATRAEEASLRALEALSESREPLHR